MGEKISTEYRQVAAVLSFVLDNAPTMPDLYLHRIGLIVGFDPDDFLDVSHGECSESFKKKVFEASRKVLKLERLDVEDVAHYILEGD